MTAVATCPQCRLQLSVPDEADALSVVRCPLCRATFQLGEVAIAPVLEMIVVQPPALEDEAEEETGDDAIDVDAEIAEPLPTDVPDTKGALTSADTTQTVEWHPNPSSAPPGE